MCVRLYLIPHLKINADIIYQKINWINIKIIL